jgi:amidase
VRLATAHAAAVKETARILAGLGHDVREVDPHYPDSTLAFLPQFFAGIRAESDGVEHFDRLEPRTRLVYHLGSWVTQGVLDRALAAGERVAERANRVFDHVDVLLTPTVPGRPRRVGVLTGTRPVRVALASTHAITWTALWNVTGNPAASVPTGLADDGLPVAVQLVGRHGDEPTLLSVAGQLERTRPWPLLTAPE